MSKRLKEIVKTIQAKKNWTMEQVAESIGYSRVHLSRVMNEEGKSDKEDALYKKLLAVLQNVTGGPEGGIAIFTEGYNDKEFLMQKATTKALYQQVARISAKVFDRPFEDCLKELEQNTILILKDLRR